jgi:hypothetical protein
MFIIIDGKNNTLYVKKATYTCLMKLYDILKAKNALVYFACYVTDYPSTFRLLYV